MLDAADLSTESKLWIGGDWMPPTGDNFLMILISKMTVPTGCHPQFLLRL